MKTPLIGIGCDVAPVSEGERRERIFSYATYLESIVRAGGTPLLIPVQAADLDRVVGAVDGLILAGGDDLSPDAYQAENRACGEILDPRRQRNDLELARLARARSIPLLGICLGCQVMNVAAGGTLVQDIASEVSGALEHKGGTGERKHHTVRIASGSCLASTLGLDEVVVNSGHHQSIREAGRGLEVVATAEDGVIEAVEDGRHPFYIGVQWHPEEMVGERAADPLFGALIEAARRHESSK